MSVGLALTPSLPSAGLASVGGPIIVVKVRVDDHELVPAEFVAFTLQ